MLKKYIGLYESLSIAIIGTIVLSFAMIMFLGVAYLMVTEKFPLLTFFGTVILLVLAANFLFRVKKAMHLLTMEENEFYVSIHNKTMKKETWTEKLTKLQITLGYTFNKGYLDNIAVLGFAGEAGEVIAEFHTPRMYNERGGIAVQEGLMSFSYAGRNVDNLKKAIKNGDMHQVPILIEDHGKLINELADHYYYYNAICQNLGISFETLAEIVYKKALANYEANPERSDLR